MMQIERSPGGSLFPYYYKDGELFCLHFGSYFSDEDRLIAMMNAEEAFLMRKHRPLGVWIDFYETKVTDRVIGEMVEMLGRVVDQITKLAIVGCPLRARWKINRLIRKSELSCSLPVKYFDEPEVAKTWLVSE